MGKRLRLALTALTRVRCLLCGLYEAELLLAVSEAGPERPHNMRTSGGGAMLSACFT